MTSSTGRNIPARNLHHVAYRCRDAEQTRWFYEEVLGFPLDVALILEDGHEASFSKSPVMHLFFALDDGSFIAFFDDPHHAEESDFIAKHGFDLHIACEVDNEEAMLDRKRALENVGVETMVVDHGFVRSLYAYDPNGIEIEFTYRTDQYRAILDGAKSTVNSDMAKWKELTQAVKAERLKSAAIAHRGPIPFDQPVLDP